MEIDKDLIEKINNELIDYPLTVRDFLDHLVLLSWINYMAHRVANVPAKNINFDGREYINVPSGRKVRITITVEDITEEIYQKELKKQEELNNEKSE